MERQAAQPKLPKVIDYGESMRLLNLGCGTRYHRDWVNVDSWSTGPEVVPYNLLGGSLPFRSNTFDVVYHSHLLEHFPKRYAPILLQECFRVMRPGGIIRVVVPNLEQIAQLYLTLLAKAIDGDEEAQKRYEWIMLEMFDQMVRNHSGGEMFEYWKQNPMPAETFVIERFGSEVLGALATLRSSSDMDHKLEPKTNLSLEIESDPILIGQFRLSGETHQWMYDRYSLSALLTSTGFKNVKIRQADESAIPAFDRYLLDIEPGGAVRKPDSLFVEAEKL
jgi:predicted SAM-dependent methyltransferase